MKRNPRAVFFGTPEFAVPILERLRSLVNLVGVVTQPPKPTGRGHRLQRSPVHALAETLHAPILTPNRLEESGFLEDFSELRPDVAILAAYGNMIPNAVLSIPKHGFLNVHPSLLPLYRGPSPVASALLAGDQVTGTTIMLLDRKMDHGPILAQRKLAIDSHEHRPSLERRLSLLGADLLENTLLPYLAGEIAATDQNHRDATFTKLVKREASIIDWRLPAVQIEHRVRALDPWPGTSTTSHGKLLKVLDAIAHPSDGNAQVPGSVLSTSGMLAVMCGDGVLELKLLQAPGSRPTEARAFAFGHRDFIGSVLGE